MKILIVDDNSDDRKLLRYIVERHGHEVIEAGNGLEGLARAAAHRPDLIISDALMPAMDGFQFLKSLKKDETLGSVPFIFYSATYTEEQDVQLGLSLGADAYIVKPKDPDELWQEVESIIAEGTKGKVITVKPVEEEKYLERYCEVVALKLEDKMKQVQENQEQVKKAKGLSDTLNDVNALIHSTLDFDEIMGMVTVEAARAVGGEASSIGILEDDDMVIKYVNNMPEEFKGRYVPARNLKGIQLAIAAKEVLAFNDAFNDERLNLELIRKFNIRSMMIAPLLSKETVLGVICLFNVSKAVAFTDMQIDFVRKLAASVSLALDNARLFTRIKQAQERASFFADAIENSSQPFAAGYPDGRLISYNKSFVDLTGYSAEELRSKIWSTDLTPPEWYEFEKAMLKELHRTGQSQTYEKEYVRKDGTRVPVEVKVQLVTDEKGAPSYYYGFITDITERKQMEKMMRHMALHDPLTDLPNRRLFTDIIGIECTQARRRRTKAALLFLDLDRFKEVNDTLGHEVGDALLKEVAARLKATVRESDTISRIGGDEFNIILTGFAAVEDISDIARKITESFRKPFSVAGHELHITTSIGISIYPDDSEDIDTLFRYADIAMYYAKEQGRNIFQFYNPEINVRSLERMRLEGMLRQTIDRGELMVYYQPQINIATRRIVCAEALVRWRHPEKGFMESKQFIPAAEETGFITAIDEYVLRTVCAQVRAWLDAGLPSLCVTVNLSAREFQDPELVNRIAQILQESNIPPHYLDVEITETLAMSNVERTVSRLNELMKIGVHTSIDDFGTGYSSLNYLKRLPIEKLKIDQSFVHDITTDPDDRAIIRAVTAMAHTMRMKVIAEGVETEEQLSFLRLTDCDEMQGYLFSKPLPAEAFCELIANSK